MNPLLLLALGGVAAVAVAKKKKAVPPPTKDGECVLVGEDRWGWMKLTDPKGKELDAHTKDFVAQGFIIHTVATGEVTTQGKVQIPVTRIWACPKDVMPPSITEQSVAVATNLAV